MTDLSHEGLRQLLREEGVSFQALRTWKRSNDPDFETKKNRILELYAIADGLSGPGPDDPHVVICLDELGPLNLQPQPGGKAWAPRAKPRRRASNNSLHTRRRNRNRAHPPARTIVKPRVVLVDDHALFRAGVRAELGERVEIIGGAESLAEAIPLIKETDPGVVLLDVQLPDGGGEGVIAAVTPDRPA